MKLFILFFIGASLLFVSCVGPGKITKKQAAGLDTITNINQLETKKRAVYKNKKNEYYIMRHEPDPRDSLEEEEEDTIQLRANSGGQRHTSFKFVSENKRCDSDKFDGSIRKGAKLSISPSDSEIFNTLTALINSLEDTAVMAAAITSNSVPRITAEDRNVHIKKAWLYAYSRQKDEDFHVIIGNTKKPYASTKYFNIEISGLPANNASSFTKIRDARITFLSKATEELCESGYFFYEKPLRIAVTGSLFFDKQHHGDDIGPASARPPTAWEIHPITFIKYY